MTEKVLDEFKGICYKPGLQIWTINNMKMVPVPEVAFGNFFEGDCYIVLHGSCDTSQSMNIHYWIGTHSSQDEQGAAAIYVTQLDEYLGGSPVQHREVQGYESPKFKGYFKSGLIYKKGGVASGFKHVDTNVYNILRLLHVKGSKNVTAREVEVSWKSFNTGDVFLLDMGKAIVQWNSPQSNRKEKLKACMLAQDIRDRERGGRVQIGVVEGDCEEATPELMKVMNSVLGQRTGPLREAVPDDIPDQYQTANIKLYQYMIPVLPISDGAESAMFKQLFKSWNEPGQTRGLGSTYTRGRIAKVDRVKFDVMELHAEPKLAAQQRMVDDASGEVQIWRIENLELQEVPRSTYGQFYGGDCYLVLYTYQKATKPQYILYMWLGRHATQDEITACAYQAVNVDNRYNGAPVQVRVTMGKEPRHFLAIFKGRLIIYEGGTGKPGVVSPDSAARLFQVRGTNEANTKATEVPARASSLNSNDVFLLKTGDLTYMWYGKGCSGDEREMGKTVADVLSKQEKQIVMEGQEPPHFWVALGGKAPYANDKRLEKETALHSPRLFECSNQTGQFRMTEVAHFTQDDLDEDDVMLLDTWEELFLWIGNSANQYEIQETYSSAAEYLKTHPAGRDADTPIITVKQGVEPPTFTGWFDAWDPHKWSGGLSYEEMKNKLGDSASVSQITVVVLLSQVKSTPFLMQPLMFLSLLPYPPRMPSLAQEYLSDADFESLLGCSRKDFQRLPKWRQSDLKKKAGLF
uniref:HP domain-containing protein n=1 Tax=Electrophorus electricus TaxID=8005 RepID=A0A4W4GVT1_ELEEL